MPEQIIEFKGLSYRLYPSSRYYRSSDTVDGVRVFRYLHRDVWAHHNGPIPPDSHVHHIDGNPFNNAPDNLACVPADEHRRDHSEEWRQWGLSCVASGQFHRMRELAKEWHRSEEGRAWHRAHGQDVWSNRKPIENTCDHCGAVYSTRTFSGKIQFCSKACKAAARRASGVDDIDKTCVVCGITFRANKYAKNVTCGRVCGGRMRRIL